MMKERQIIQLRQQKRKEMLMKMQEQNEKSGELEKQKTNLRQSEKKAEKEEEEEFPYEIYKCFYCQSGDRKCKVCDGKGKFTA